MTTTQALSWIHEWLIQELKLTPQSIDNDRPLVSYGLDSVHAMMLVGDLEDLLQRRFSPTLAWDYPTVRALAAHLSAENEPPQIRTAIAGQRP